MKTTMLRIVRSVLLLPLLLALTAAGAPAQEDASTVRVGESELALPAPEGFRRVDGRDRALDTLVRATVPPTNRLLGFFITEEAAQALAMGLTPPMERNLNAQALRALEKGNVSAQDFQQLKSLIRDEIAGLPRVPGETMRRLEAQGDGALLDYLRNEGELTLGEPLLLEIFDDTPESLAFLMAIPTLAPLPPASAEEEEAAEEGAGGEEADRLRLNLAASCPTFIAGKVVYLYANSKYTSEADRAWVKETIAAWREKVLAANAAASD